MAAADQPSTYCCACLNVRVPAQPAPSGAPTESTVSSDEERSFKVIYVPENGIQVAHPQLTARDREPIESVLRHKRDRRYVSVTCLLCNVLVYRVLHALTSAIAHDGPVLPTEDWVETEVLQSSTGVVEVHKSCVSGTAVDNLLQSPDYSSLLNIVLPPPPEGSSTPPSSASPAVSYIIAAKTANAASQTRTYLPPIPALFNPAPFTPSHPVFLHFAEAASVESARLRSAAEEEIATTIRRKLMELERSDGDLRRQVYTVWRVFSSRLASIRGEADLEGLSSPNGLGRRRNSNATGASSPTLVGPQSMRNFNPPSTKPVRPISAHGLPRESALSASLVTSKMHYRREGQPDSPGQPTPADRNAAGVSASVPANRRLDAYRSGAQDEGQAIILEAYRRKVNDDPNVAASLQVREGMHAAMNKRREQKREKLAAANAEQKEEGEEHPDPNGKGKEKAKEVNESATAGDAAESSTSPSRGSPKENGSKPRRKVTFDVKPAVVTINTNSATGQNTSPIAQQPSESINGDGIFDFEDDNGALEEANENNSTEVTTPVLPLIPSTPASTRPARSRKAATPTGLPSSLSSLRPSSLPGPSTLRNLSLLPRPTRTISPLNPAPPEAAVVNSESEGESGAASSTGKHTKDSPVRQNSGKASYPTVIKEEEDRSYDNDTDNDLDEDEDERSVEDSDPQTSTSPSALARSLPIAIGSTAMRRAHEQRKAYQPKTSLRDRPEMVVPALRSPDRPYATGETQKNDLGVIEEESGPAAELQGAGDRGRNHALKILVARSKIPDEKMWRSMAA